MLQGKTKKIENLVKKLARSRRKKMKRLKTIMKYCRQWAIIWQCALLITIFLTTHSGIILKYFFKVFLFKNILKNIIFYFFKTIFNINILK
jgi:hypothetical protein